MSQSSIPTLILSGFLGAGKTTLLRELIPGLEAALVHPLVILNDYKNAKVDASSLEADGRTVKPINGNCVCCDSLGELVLAMENLPDRPRQVLLLESNGTSDPASLLQQLLFRPVLRQRFSPILQVTCVNALRWQKRFWNNELERLQVRTASHLVMTHTGQLSESRKQTVAIQVAECNPRASWTSADGILAELVNLATAKGPVFTSLPQNLPVDGKLHATGEHDHALSHAFVADQFELPSSVSRERLIAWVAALPQEILRVKGIARFMETPGTDFVFERTDDHRWGPTVFALNQPSTIPPCVVLIGVRLDSHSIQSSLSSLAL
jgi:G3E family GTPase